MSCVELSGFVTRPSIVGGHPVPLPIGIPSKVPQPVLGVGDGEGEGEGEGLGLGDGLGDGDGLGVGGVSGVVKLVGLDKGVPLIGEKYPLYEPPATKPVKV